MRNINIIWTFFASVLLSGAEITVLHTTDTHGALSATPETASVFAANTVPGKTLIIDCGDLIQGTYDAQTDRGAAAVAALNALGFDVWTAGNHDLDFGLETYLSRVKEFRGAALAGNWKLNGKPSAAWRMFEFDGVKVAVIGMGREDQNVRSYHPGFSVDCESEAAALARIVPEVKAAGAAVIILARHAGNYDRTGSLWALAAQFPDIDLVLGGHTHQEEPGEASANVFYAQAGSHAGWLGVVRIEVDDASGRVTQISGRLVGLPAAPPVTDESKLVVELPTRLITPVRRTANNLLCWTAAAAMRDLTGADAAFYGGRAGGLDYPARVTERVLFGMFPYSDEVGVAELTGAELTAVLQEHLNEFGDAPYSLSVDGVRVMADGELKITQIFPIREKYVVAFTSFAAIGANGKFSPVTGFRSTGVSLRDAVGRYLAAGKFCPATGWLEMKKQKNTKK
ncbi:MAG: metallophosphoesterase [Victivallaceae bacterium]|nr:metallophosphoesterase [Victivallaceae bacterium]